MYNKLFAKILDSSIWLEPTPTRIVWLTLIAAMDEDGYTHFASVVNLAHRARVTIEEAEQAVAILEGPDQDSSDPENEGRRIERLPGGWLVLNAEKHRELVSREVSRERTRLRMKRYRERLKQSVTVTERDGSLSNVTQSEAVSEEEDLNSNNKLSKGAGVSTTSVTKRNGAPDARSKHPVFKGQRIVVFDWMLEDLTRLLGPHADAFNLDEWFYALDADAVKTALVIPLRDKGAWLQAQTLAEAKRRGLPILELDASGNRKQTPEEQAAEGLAEIKARRKRLGDD